MRLRLKNIRQHADTELELPDSGIIMIQGESGAGKSTILDAIEEALYGSGSDFPTWGSTKSAVELEWLGMKIMRTRGPHSLTVEDGSGTYRDDAAQQVIINTIGMSEQEFAACSYIKQGLINSLLSYGPADQLKFIESLSFGKSDVDGLKKKITTKISELEKEVAGLSSSFAAQQQIHSQISDTINDTLSRHEMPSEPKEGLVAAITQVKTDLDSIIKQKADLSTQIDLKNKTIRNSEDYKVVKSWERDRIRLDEEIAQVELNINKNNEFLSTVATVWGLGTKDETQAKLDLLKHQIVYIKTKNSIKTLAEKIYSAYPESKGTNLTQFLTNKDEELRQKATDATTKKTEAGYKLSSLADKKKPQPCPECNAPLGIVSGRIVKNSDVPDNIDEIRADLDALIKTLASEVLVCSKDSKVLSEWLFEATRLKQVLAPTEPMPSIKTEEEATKEERVLIAYIADQSALEAKKASVSGSIKDLTDTKNKKIAQRDGLRASYEKIISSPDYVSESIMGAEIEKLVESRAIIDSTETSIRKKLDSLREIERAMAAYDQAQITTKDLSAKLDVASAKMTETKSKINELHNKLAATIRLKELSDFASVAAIENTIVSINASSEAFVNKMFESDGTFIRLKNSSTTKSGDERAKLSTEIFHKGKAAKKLSSLSGGERSRACLAFQLGLSELYESPILMIDEGFSGLDLPKKQDCLEVIKDVSGKKLILVIEHGAPESFFDEVKNVK